MCFWNATLDSTLKTSIILSHSICHHMTYVTVPPDVVFYQTKGKRVRQLLKQETD